jgi:hypothetical protein
MANVERATEVGDYGRWDVALPTFVQPASLARPVLEGRLGRVRSGARPVRVEANTTYDLALTTSLPRPPHKPRTRPHPLCLPTSISASLFGISLYSTELELVGKEFEAHPSCERPPRQSRR